MTPVAARLTALRLGRESFRPLDLRAEEARFVFLPLLRAALLRPPPFRAALLRPTLLRAGRFLPFDFRAGDFRLLERPAMAARMGQAARRRAARVFDWDRHVTAYKALYQKVAVATPHAPAGEKT